MAGLLKPRIVILGAGMAGISSAHHLVTSGLSNVKILEATDRIGGRIHTVEFGDGTMPAELGANWIHGAVMNNSTFKLAESVGALTPYRIFNRMSGRFLKDDGTAIGRDLVTRCWNKFQEIRRTAQTIISDEIKQGKRKNYLTVLLGLFEEYIDEIKGTGISQDDMKRVFNALCTYTAFHEGDDLDKISFECDETTCVMSGGDIHVPRGYKFLLHSMIKHLPTDVIEFNSEVVNIQWKTKSGEVIIKTGNGNTLVADHVIVTCSLGVLKTNHETLFTPLLPSRKTGVIRSIGFGCVNKILLEYDKPVSGIKSGNVIISWLANEIANMKTDWVKGIFGFDTIYTKQKVLLAWISGKAARYIETLADDEIGNGCTNLLRKFLADPSFPEPKRVMITRWCSNPYTRGSYSYQTHNLIQNEQGILSEPLKSQLDTPVVLFAGEATSRENYSTTHGARDSGIREAKRLLNLYSEKHLFAKL